MRIHVSVVAALVLLSTPSVAQKRVEPSKEPTFAEAVAQAGKAFEAKEYGAAVSALQAAMRAVQKVQRVAILAALPKPEGYEFKDEDSQDADANPFGVSMAALGLNLNRHYWRDEQTIDLEVMANSPMVGMIAMMFSNPVIVKADGGELVEYGQHKAILKHGDDDYLELTILMHDKHVVKATSRGLTVDALFAVVDQAAIDRLEKPLGK